MCCGEGAMRSTCSAMNDDECDDEYMMLETLGAVMRATMFRMIRVLLPRRHQVHKLSDIACDDVFLWWSLWLAMLNQRSVL